jgi:HTH-type transcriptional regulator, sugar sensing transcriptional regulator
MQSERIESVMTGLGFSLYESRAYAALVADNPLNGYELSGKSGIPRSKVYECIERLVRKGLLVALEGSPVRYAPVPPGELVRRLSGEFEASLTLLERLLTEVKPVGQAEYVFNIGGYEGILEKAADMIRGSLETIDLALWGEEFTLLHEELEQANSRGVRTRLLLFGMNESGSASAPPFGLEEFPGCEVYRHPPIAAGEYSEKWLAVVCDRSEVLTGQCSGGEDAVAAWTRNRSLVFVSLKYIEHEILRIREHAEK